MIDRDEHIKQYKEQIRKDVVITHVEQKGQHVNYNEPKTVKLVSYELGLEIVYSGKNTHKKNEDYVKMLFELVLDDINV